MTAQISDILRFEGRSFSLSCEPLMAWLSRRKNKELRFRRTNTACRRGYVAEWTIQRGRLYVTSIAGTLSDGAPATLAAVFANYSKQYLDSVGANDPSNTGPGAFAFWVTGTLCCSFGKLLKYEHLGYESIHASELHLCMKDGFLVGTRIVHRELPCASDDIDTDCRFPFNLSLSLFHDVTDSLSGSRICRASEQERSLT